MTQATLPPGLLAGATARPPEPPLTVVIRPAGGWQAVNYGELWRYRELLFFLVWRDVKVRYKQTALGVAWAILQPLMMMAVFALFFGRMAGLSSGDMPYPLFAFAGLLPWTFFATAVGQAGQSVVGSERLVSKVYFPRLAIPFASVGAAAVDFVIACGLLGVLMAWYGVRPGWGFLLVPPILAVLALTALGVGALLAALNVRYRDFRYVVPFLLQFWMFATPTVYMQPGADLSPALRLALGLNPLSGLVAAFRGACLGGDLPWAALAGSTACAAILFVGGCLYFRRAEADFADII
jgi:lipopolysaccharide transport system permease protein